MRRGLGVDGMAWVMLSALLCLGAIIVTTVSAGKAGGPVAHALDWQAALGLREPWRLWTCAWVHGSAAHLLVNIAGGGVVAFVGWRARLPPAAALAWLLAWPGTQWVMAGVDNERLAAAMPHYFGLSGVLHAGVAVLGLSLAWPRARPPAGQRAEAGFVGERALLTPSSHAAGQPSPIAARVAATPLPTTPREPPPSPAGGERWIGVAIIAGTLAKLALEAPWDLAPRASEALGIAVAPVAHACGVAAGVLAWTAVRLFDRRRR